MTHRTIEADVLEFKDRLVVIKSDEITHEMLKAFKKSFAQNGHDKIVLVGLGAGDSIETFTKQQAIEMLRRIIEKPEETT